MAIPNGGLARRLSSSSWATREREGVRTTILESITGRKQSIEPVEGPLTAAALRDEIKALDDKSVGLILEAVASGEAAFQAFAEATARKHLLAYVDEIESREAELEREIEECLERDRVLLVQAREAERQSRLLDQHAEDPNEFVQEIADLEHHLEEVSNRLTVAEFEGRRETANRLREQRERIECELQRTIEQRDARVAVKQRVAELRQAAERMYEEASDARHRAGDARVEKSRVRLEVARKAAAAKAMAEEIKRTPVEKRPGAFQIGFPDAAPVGNGLIALKDGSHINPETGARFWI